MITSLSQAFPFLFFLKKLIRYLMFQVLQSEPELLKIQSFALKLSHLLCQLLESSPPTLAPEIQVWSNTRVITDILVVYFCLVHFLPFLVNIVLKQVQ